MLKFNKCFSKTTGYRWVSGSICNKESVFCSTTLSVSAYRSATVVSLKIQKKRTGIKSKVQSPLHGLLKVP